MTAQQIHVEQKLDEILTRWMKAGPEERARLLIERLQLESRLEQLRRKRGA